MPDLLNIYYVYICIPFDLNRIRSEGEKCQKRGCHAEGSPLFEASNDSKLARYSVFISCGSGSATEVLAKPEPRDAKPYPRLHSYSLLFVLLCFACLCCRGPVSVEHCSRAHVVESETKYEDAGLFLASVSTQSSSSVST